MEALFRVGEALEWTPATAPRGSLLLLRDCVDAGGAFLVHHFFSLFAKAGASKKRQNEKKLEEKKLTGWRCFGVFAGHRVVLVNTTQSKEHYAAVARKLVTSLHDIFFQRNQQGLRLGF